MNTKNNQHYRSTHMVIQNTFLTLLQSKTLQQISVREICNLAQINRSTFYTHYSSIYDLMEELDSILRVQTMEHFQNADIPLPGFFSADGIQVILEYMYAHQDFYQVYLGHIGAASYIKGVFEELWTGNEIHSFWPGAKSREQTYHAFQFFMSGTIGLIQLWLENGCSPSPADIAKRIFSFIPRELITCGSGETIL